jgi:hypothetical protein
VQPFNGDKDVIHRRVLFGRQKTDGEVTVVLCCPESGVVVAMAEQIHEKRVSDAMDGLSPAYR